MVAPPAPAALLTAHNGMPARAKPSNGSSPSPNLVSAQAGFACYAAGGWVTIANYPSGFATGNCPSYTSLDRQVCGSTTCDWSGGFVYGNYNGCGWAATSSLLANGGSPANTACSDPRRPLNTFASYTNCAPGTCTDGATTTLAANCQEYANYRPWSATPGFSDPVHIYSGQVTVWWRYITANGAAVMVHDPNAGGAGHANWVFVPYSCIVGGFPGRYDVRGYTGYI